MFILKKKTFLSNFTFSYVINFFVNYNNLGAGSNPQPSVLGINSPAPGTAPF